MEYGHICTIATNIGGRGERNYIKNQTLLDELKSQESSYKKKVFITSQHHGKKNGAFM